MEKKKSVENISSYLSGLNSTIRGIKNIQSIYDPLIAFQFNLFNFWSPKENKTSRILSFFLDPSQTHGQGDVFLKVFLNKLNLDSLIVNSMNHVNVKCEYGIDYQRRIDILLSFSHEEFGIAIENKFYAPDQQDQLFDYSDFLSKRFKNYILIYLTPNGKEPSEVSINKDTYSLHTKDGKIKIVGYTNVIIDMVHEWAMVCRAERVRNFLYDLEQYFKQTFLGDTFMNQSEVIAEYVQSNINNVEAAFETYKSFNLVISQVGKNFAEKLTERLGQKFSGDEWVIKNDGNFNVVISNINWPCKTRVGIMNYDGDNVHFGAKCESENRRDLFGYIKSANSGNENINAYWIKLEPIYNTWFDNLEGFKKIYAINEDTISYMIDGGEKLIDLTSDFFKQNPMFY